MRDNFSIQDWRMKLLTEAENEMPVGNREIPMKEVGSMKTKTIANPNAGKWRIVGIDSGRPLTGEFYNSKEEAMAAFKKLGQVTDSGVKIVQLKDTSTVYTTENEMPWGDDTITEASNQMTPETRAALNAVTMLGADEVKDFLIGLVKYFNYVSSGEENEIPNIDVKALTHHLSQAATVLAARTGN